MYLEDHLGDILRKGRLHAGLTLEAVAVAADLTVPELEALEESGHTTKPINYPAVGTLLSLEAAKLRGIAEGWTPPVIDLGIWRELRVITTSGLGMSVNAYLVWDEVTRDAALFDTGFDAAPVLALIREHGLELRHVFITHGHGDHIAALPAIRESLPKARLRSGAKTAPVDQRNRPNECLQLGSLRITPRETPGHAEDGVTYVIGTWPEDAPHVAVVGDALFAGSMGKAIGQAALARQKIRESILSLPPDTLLCPGHGPLTTVAEEKAHNPFFA
jgi:glyoxylase-like metal-dependent hydrolase (beta-lactamase superfamily II)